MSEIGRIDAERYELVCSLVKSMYDRLVGQVIADIKALPDSCRQSGDDSKLKDVWEEYKYQIQREEFLSFELYVHVIRGICATRVQELERDRQQLLWLWTEGYLDLWVRADKVSLDDWNPDAIAAVEAELYDRVANIAVNEEFEVDPDEERDRDRFRRDVEEFYPQIQDDKEA
jgi:hypothetical protein